MFESDLHLLETLTQLGELLAIAGVQIEFVIAGGAGLIMQHIIQRGTQDVDVFAIRTPTGELVRATAGLPPQLVEAAREVGSRQGLAVDWLNAQMARGSDWLPPDFEARIRWMELPGLRIGLVGRPDFIAFKLEAAADWAPGMSKHLNDLVALKPSDTELAEAERWLAETNADDPFFANVAWARSHVADHRSKE
ncbi:MAG TPA: DUF6036 family nucleotidyltransferase [Gemmatimonadaceae bacterium]